MGLAGFQGINGHWLSLSPLSLPPPCLCGIGTREEKRILGLPVLWSYRLFLWVDSINILTLIDLVGFEHWKLDSQRKLQAFQVSASLEDGVVTSVTIGGYRAWKLHNQVGSWQMSILVTCEDSVRTLVIHGESMGEDRFLATEERRYSVLCRCRKFPGRFRGRTVCIDVKVNSVEGQSEGFPARCHLKGQMPRLSLCMAGLLGDGNSP